MVMSEAKKQFGAALAVRRQGMVSNAGADTPFAEVKPEMYADSKLLIARVMDVFDSYRDQYPPYGLVGRTGSPVIEIQIQPNHQYRAVRTTEHWAILDECRLIPRIMMSEALTRCARFLFPEVSLRQQLL